MKLQTPFYSKHLEHGAQWLEAPGFLWQLPKVYTTIEKECLMVRERAGFIDYSLHGVFAVAGREAFAFLQKILVNDLRKISPDKTIYSSLLDETGTVIDDITVFWVEENLFALNVLRKQYIYEWLKKNARGLDVCIIETGKAMLALQGPKSRDILQKVVNIKDLPYFSLVQEKINDIPALIVRLGFTGELGYELWVYPEYAHALWDTLMELGKEDGVCPYGLEAGRIMALEKGYLFATDFYEGSTLLEVGLGWTVAFDKGEFIGKETLVRRREEGFKTKLMYFEVSDPQVVASIGDNLVKAGRVVGRVTRAGYGPTLRKSIGRGWVEIGHAREGEELEVEHGGKRTKINLVRGPWYDPENKRIKA